MIWIFSGIGFVGVVIFVVWYVRRELEVRDMLRQAYDAENSLERGIAVFKIETEEQEKIFEILTKRKIMQRNPLGGYSFAKAHTSLMSRAVKDRVEYVEKDKGDENGRTVH
jgi:hypothetical protein